jgi:hypothetical protein
MSWARRFGVRASAILVVVLVLGSPLLAWAHSDPLAPVSIDQPSQHPCQGPAMQLSIADSMVGALPWAPLAFMLSGLVAVAMARGLRQWRRAAMFGLVLVLGTFAFGTAVHSVHHLSEPLKAAECPVFSASQHITGTLADPGDLYVPIFALTRTSPSACEAPTFSSCFQPAQPRAPPAFPAS